MCAQYLTLAGCLANLELPREHRGLQPCGGCAGPPLRGVRVGRSGLQADAQQQSQRGRKSGEHLSVLYDTIFFGVAATESSRSSNASTHHLCLFWYMRPRQAVARGLGASGARPVVIDAEFLQLMLKHAGAEAHTVASSTGHSEAQQGTGMRENGSKVDAQGASTAARAADTRPHQARASAVENGGHVHRDSTQSTQTQEMGAQVAPEDAQLGHVENVVSRTVAS